MNSEGKSAERERNLRGDRVGELKTLRRKVIAPESPDISE